MPGAPNDAGVLALDGIDLRVAPKERVVLLGANGCGKSTLLKILDGLLIPGAGDYRFQGEAVTQASLRQRDFSRRFRAQVALLFQHPEAMLFHPTVLEEIAFGPKQLGMEGPEDRARAWAAHMGLSKHLETPPYLLSGGEKQRLALAALLAVEPQLLLLDEPTAHLDPRATGWLVDFLADLDITLVVATHVLSLAPELGSRAIILGEDHRIAFDGPLEAALADLDLLVAANLAHTHRHRHGDSVHRHFHVHDWD
ncbi:MAG: ABC transporter [Proteobacteria bacterium CG1_02_64_396]|nr:MAG: ABC transporter [Proteobacteria bacterium CG1_02_64_396]